ncbi:DUF2637 domain-containing protein [Streptomyces sp. NPDC055966]|uniref:DUF2637 domain-containing protein n=1 Tax=Streptomyces sp. NPDC055966 TaxID=3345669 RepID=UPI0035D8CF10
MNTTPAGNEPHRPGGPLAPTAPGNTPTATLQPLTRAQKTIAAFVGTGTAFIAALGFAGSYSSVTVKAHALGFGWFANWITIGVDAGIGIFLALDLLLTWLRMPYPLLRHIAWLLTAATITFNASASWPNPLGVGMHAVIPVLFIAATEAARHAIGRIADITADKHMEGPPPSRWFLNPASTFILWRRQRLWGIRLWDTVLELERERRIYIGQLRREHGRGWRRAANADQLLVLRLAKDGMSIQDAIDLPKREAGKLAAAAAKRAAEARTKAEAEAEAKHQAELRSAEAEAKRRAEIAEAEAAEARARAEAEAAAEAARLEVEAKRVAETEAARLLVAETEAKLARLARQERDAEAEAELNRQRRVAEQDRLRVEAARRAREEEAAEAQRRREQELRERAQRIVAQASTASASTSGSTSGSASKPASTSASTSGSVSALGGRGAKKQAEVEAVLARMVEANDPEAVSLKWIQEHFDLKQTTAWDRLVTAQQLYAEAQNPKSEKTA